MRSIFLLENDAKRSFGMCLAQVIMLFVFYEKLDLKTNRYL